MTQSPLFSENTPPLNSEQNKDYLAEFVGEGKKYKDVTELAKAYAHLQTHTQIIQNENREFRSLESELTAKTKALEENYNRMMEELKTIRAQPSDAGKPVNPSLQSQPSAPEVNKEVLGPADLKRIVQETLKEQSTASQREANLNAVNQKAVEMFGSLEAANEFVKKKSSEQGLSLTDVAEVAMKSPKAFFELMGLSETKPTLAPNREALKSDMNTKAGLSFGKPAHEDPTKWEYYSKLRKEKPELYWKPETQATIHKLVMKGEMSLPS